MALRLFGLTGRPNKAPAAIWINAPLRYNTCANSVLSSPPARRLYQFHPLAKRRQAVPTCGTTGGHRLATVLFPPPVTTGCQRSFTFTPHLRRRSLNGVLPRNATRISTPQRLRHVLTPSRDGQLFSKEITQLPGKSMSAH